MRYTYRCGHGHTSEKRFPIGEAPSCTACRVDGCRGKATRDLFADLQSVQIQNDDPWRRAWLSPKTARALSEQNRPMDPLAPKDKFERRHVERATGRNYIGDDASGLRPNVQKAIAAHEEKRRQREVA